MKITTDVTGVDKYISIIGILSNKLVNNKPYCELQPKALKVYAYLLYYKNNVYGEFPEDVGNRLTFSTETKQSICDALEITGVGFSNYTKNLKEKGILNEDKKSFNKKFLIPDLKEFSIIFE